VEGYTPAPGSELQVDFRTASPDYFRTMQIPLVAGCFFSGADRIGTQPVAIIDEKFAKRFWPHESPLGKHLWFNPKTPMTISGVVKVVKQYALDDEGKIAVYFPLSQQPYQAMYLVMRTSSDPAGIARPVTDVVRAIEPSAVVTEVQTLQDLLYHSLARRRFAATMLFAFAAFALLLAMIGVYGVLSYLVSQNRQEIGMRIALGATPTHVLGLVVRYGMGVAAIGIGFGLIGAFSLTRLMSSLLFGITPTDPLTFASVLFVLVAVALAATILPAWRATRVDPMIALRQE
jgi:predicted permease